MQSTRRTVLKGLAAAAAAVAAAGGVTAYPRRRASAAAPPVLAPQGTTLDSTIVRGAPVNPQGYVLLASGPGEPHVTRTDLGTAPQAGREGRRRAVLSFVHLTDIHVIDAQSPARVEFLDRYDDDEQTRTLFSAAYRPQEMLMPQYSDAVVRAVERVGRGPVAGRAFDFALCTGDNTDNAQRNEQRWQIDVLDGTRTQPGSGDPQVFEGVSDQNATTYDIHYWHPDGTPAGALEDDNLRRVHGFPVVSGLLEASQQPFTPVGLSIPWFTCYGNHDGLVQGNFPRSFQLNNVAVGPVKVISLPAGVSPDDIRRMDPAAAAALTTGPARTVTPDADRKIMSRTECISEHFTTGGTPLGHGYTSQNLADGTAYYAFDPSPLVRAIVLDSVNPNGNSGGSLDPEQFAWLRTELEQATGPGRDKLVVVFSHHTIETMDNPIVFVDDPRPRVQGPEVRDLLLQFPNVVALVNGHTHRNVVTPFTREGGGGFWQVNTAAHVDWPCQARLLEIVDNADGTLSIFGTIIDADAPLSYGGRLDSPGNLASLARELAANDPQTDGSDASSGSAEDRNVELLVAAPFSLQAPAPPQEPPTQQPQPGQGQPGQGQPGQGQPPAGTGRSRPPGRSLPATGGSTGAAAGAAAVLGAAAVAARATRRER